MKTTAPTVARFSAYALLVGGTTAAIALRPGRGTCGLPPFGTDEFCFGNDYGLKWSVFVATAGLAGVTFIVGSSVSRRFLLAAAVALLAGLAVAALIPTSTTCPGRLRLNYYLTAHNSPLCSAAAPSAASGTAPLVNQRTGLRAAVVSAGAGLALLLVAEEAAERKRRRRFAGG